MFNYNYHVERVSCTSDTSEWGLENELLSLWHCVIDLLYSKTILNNKTMIH